MNELLLLLFAGGVGLGVLLALSGVAPKPKPKPALKFPRKDRLDTTDEMFLWGEVNNDGDYRM